MNLVPFSDPQMLRKEVERKGSSRAEERPREGREGREGSSSSFPDLLEMVTRSQTPSPKVTVAATQKPDMSWSLVRLILGSATTNPKSSKSWSNLLLIDPV